MSWQRGGAQERPDRCTIAPTWNSTQCKIRSVFQTSRNQHDACARTYGVYLECVVNTRVINVVAYGGDENRQDIQRPNAGLRDHDGAYQVHENTVQNVNRLPQPRKRQKRKNVTPLDQ